MLCTYENAILAMEIFHKIITNKPLPLSAVITYYILQQKIKKFDTRIVYVQKQCNFQTYHIHTSKLWTICHDNLH